MRHQCSHSETFFCVLNQDHDGEHQFRRHFTEAEVREIVAKALFNMADELEQDYHFAAVENSQQKCVGLMREKATDIRSGKENLE